MLFDRRLVDFGDQAKLKRFDFTGLRALAKGRIIDAAT
jgi:hypothetical protein